MSESRTATCRGFVTVVGSSGAPRRMTASPVEVRRTSAYPCCGTHTLEVTQIAQPGVANLVEPHELIESIGTPIRQHEPIEGDGEAGLAVRLDRLRLPEHA